MREKIIDEFEEMINDVCGPKVRKLPGRPKVPTVPTVPTPDFYEQRMYHDDFMKWYYDKEKDKQSMKVTAKCVCGVTYKIYTEPMPLPTISYNNDIGGSTAATSWYEQTEIVKHHRFYCWKCGAPFVVTGSKIKKIESNQLEVVL